MAPFMSYGQSLVDEYNKQRLVEEYLKEHGQPIDGSSPPIHAQDEASVSVESDVTDSSEHTSLDQSNNGFSFINLHWASFSTGLSSVLAVVLVGLAIASCCYFRGRRQRQARSRPLRRSPLPPRRSRGPQGDHARRPLPVCSLRWHTTDRHLLPRRLILLRRRSQDLLLLLL